MSEREEAWHKWSDARPDDDEIDPVSFTAGYDIGHASAEAKYAPALSAAEAERDLARRANANWDRNELTVTAISAAYRTYRNTRDLHELARAVGQILNGPDDVQPESEWKTVERPDEVHG